MTLDNTMTYHIVIALVYKNKTTKKNRVHCCKSSYTHQANKPKKEYIARHIFSKLVTHFLVLQLQVCISL